MIGINQSPDPIIRPACQFPNTSIASWNMRGSMFPKVQGEKNINRQKTVKRLCQNNDIVMLQECYVTGHFDQENRRYTGQINLIKEMLPDHIILMNYVLLLKKNICKKMDSTTNTYDTTAYSRAGLSLGTRSAESRSLTYIFQQGSLLRKLN